MDRGGLEEEAVAQPAFSQRLPLLLPGFMPGISPTPSSPFDQATKLYDYLSSRNTADRKAVFAFRARNYDATVPAESHATPGFWVGTLTRDEVNEACPLRPVVQDRTDLAADTIKMLGNYKTPSEYGTRVHKELELGIRRLHDDRLVPEYSLLKSGGEVGYGTLNSFRLDILERALVDTACIHDVKTGRSPLTAARSSELAFAVHKTFPGTKRIVVIEMRPYEQP